MSSFDPGPAPDTAASDGEASENGEPQEPPGPPPKYDCPCHYCRDDDTHELPALGTEALPFHALAATIDGILDIELRDYRGKWLVLFTFPSVARNVTPSEIIAFSENYRRFTDINCDVLGLTLENAYTIFGWTELGRPQGGIGPINYSIASDVGHDISRRYGLLEEDEDDLNRATFILDPEGIVKHIDITVPTVGRSVEEIIRLVKAFQFAAESGEMCPAQWKEGEASLKPTFSESKNYFGQRN
jgi:alkyl hydroperoxide reductase subunit AhpC